LSAEMNKLISSQQLYISSVTKKVLKLFEIALIKFFIPFMHLKRFSFILDELK
jgi:hypothetical protein